MTTSYYPNLTWNGLGYSFPTEHNGIPAPKESQMLLSDLGFFAQETHDSDQPFVGIDRSRKIFSAKNILRDISRRYSSVNQEFSYASDKFFPEHQAYLHSDLLYLIAATDGNEDTVGHSQLVSRYTLLLTKALGIDDRAFSVGIERGALLHDIGKIGIPDSILRKPGSLTDKEREIVKEHPFLGYEMVEEFMFLQKASRVVLFHHESYDGRGYPYGLKGEEIPLEARIFAIADTLDAITSDRPYRKGKSFQVAFGEIERVRGTQFDPYIVDAFLSIPEEKWQQIKRETEQSLSNYSIH
ncbi:MAG: HD-GYP domain-containing protein [Candidatus Aminicenantes bacterium]|nr:MAG: HD-GYP domain-containing protein [Candidatus Aminicenantes bacterium]